MQQRCTGVEELLKNQSEFAFFEKRMIMISEGITSEVAKRVVTSLLALDALDSKAPITIYQNSPGGEINSGFAIYDTIRFIRPEVKIVNTGLCASIATIINIAAKKENRLSMPNCRFLIHQPLIAGQVRGPASDLEITATEIIKTRAKLNAMLAEACSQPLDKVEKDTTRDYWMSATESLEYGLISKIITSLDEVK